MAGIRPITALRICGLAEQRKRDGVSLTRQSLSMGMGKDTLAQYMKGAMLPGAVNIKAMCRYYRVSADWLLGLEDE